MFTPSIRNFDLGIEDSAQLLPIMTIRAVTLLDDGTAHFNHSQLPIERARIKAELQSEGFTTASCIHAYNIRRSGSSCSVVLDSEDPSCPSDINKPTCEKLMQAAGCSDYVYGCLTSSTSNSKIVRLLQPEFYLSPQAGVSDPTITTIPTTPTAKPTPIQVETPTPTPIPTATPEPSPSPSPTPTPVPTQTPNEPGSSQSEPQHTTQLPGEELHGGRNNQHYNHSPRGEF